MDLDHDIGKIDGNVSIIDPGSNTLTVLGNKGIAVPSGTSGERAASPDDGTIRNNTTTNNLEAYVNGQWMPYVRTLGELDDVTIASVSPGNVIQFNGTEWTNVGSTPASATGILSTWTPAGGGRYYADFIHGIGTTDVVITLYNNLTNAVIQAYSIVCTSNSTVRVTVTGNSTTVKIVVVANGLGVGVVNGGGVPVIIQDLFVNRPAAGVAGRLFFSYDTKVIYRDNGTSWDIMSASSGAVRTLSYFANSLDSPNTADFAVNSMAPVISDATNAAINVRSFSNTTEQGVAMMVPVPVGANNITFVIRGRPTTAPAGAANVQHRLYIRAIPENSAMGAWSAATNFTSFAIPTNAYYQKLTQSYTISALGLAVNRTYHFELTRNVTGVTNNLTNPWLVSEVTVVFD